MRKLTVVLMLLLVVILAACGGQNTQDTEPTETPVQEVEQGPTAAPPTEVPPTEVPPTEEPAATEVPVEEVPDSSSSFDTMEHSPDPNLVNITWEWERRDPNGNDVPEIVVSNPENYTLLFNEDGTFNATVGLQQCQWCLQNTGSWQHFHGIGSNDHGSL